MRRVLGLTGVVVLGLLLAAALLMPLTGYDVVTDADSMRASLSPSWAHWLGTDHAGRDIAARLAWASRSFVGPGLLAGLVATVLGVPAGAVAGYWEPAAGPVRYLFSVLSAVPRFVLVLLVCTIYGDETWLLALAVGIAYTPTLGEALYARIASLRHADFIAANRAYGLPGWRILWVHLVWAAGRRLIARHLLILFGYFAVLETTLAYIGGFGVQEPMPSWGNMLVYEWGQESWVGVAAPAVAIWLVVAAAGWVAQALQEPTDA